MTRKDYIKIAGAIRKSVEFTESLADLLPAKDRTQRVRGIYETTANIADILKEDNPNFNRTKFLKAAGV